MMDLDQTPLPATALEGNVALTALLSGEAAVVAGCELCSDLLQVEEFPSFCSSPPRVASRLLKIISIKTQF